MAYNIIFYEKDNGVSEVWTFLENLCKKTQKTPRREIEKAKFERDDYLSRSVDYMKNWEDYKTHVKETDPERGKDLADIEEQATIISAMVNQRKALGLSQRELASICGVPQSSVARIESFETTPNLATLLKLFRPLGLKLTVSK